MELKIDPNGIWYHGSNMVFSELREGSTITQWKELAEAFSHQPDRLSYDDNGIIYHNGTEKGYLYVKRPSASLLEMVCNPRLTHCKPQMVDCNRSFMYVGNRKHTERTVFYGTDKENSS